MPLEQHKTEDSTPAKEEHPEAFKFIFQQDFSTLSDIANNFRNGYYHNTTRLLSDLTALCENVLSKRCKNQLARNYVIHFLEQSFQLLQQK